MVRILPSNTRHLLILFLFSWVGIVKGAVLRGMGVGTAPAPTVRSCPRHYGICVSHKYEEWQNLGENTVKDSFHGQRMVPDHLSWLVRQGDAILPTEPIDERLGVRCKLTKQQYALGSNLRITFVASSNPEPPSTMANLSRGMFDSSSPGNRICRILYFQTNLLTTRQPTAENTVIFLDVNSKEIPFESLQKQKKSGGGNYLTAELEVVLTISDKVYINVVHDGVCLASESTNLA